jgi:hypothetical protein
LSFWTPASSFLRGVQNPDLVSGFVFNSFDHYRHHSHCHHRQASQHCRSAQRQPPKQTIISSHRTNLSSSGFPPFTGGIKGGLLSVILDTYILLSLQTCSGGLRGVISSSSRLPASKVRSAVLRSFRKISGPSRCPYCQLKIGSWVTRRYAALHEGSPHRQPREESTP